jgi:FMN-dependent NADH-azoreductase
MTTLLQIQTSIFSDEGESSRLARKFVAAWQAADAARVVIARDLGREPVPHLTAERLHSFRARPEDRTPEQRVVAEYSDTLIDELRRADVIALGLPMYNFGPPSSLKAYFDHVARPGVTFRYTDKGAQGLLTGKKAWIFAARGGYYAGTPLDTQTAFVRDFMRFLGIDELEFVYAEGLAMGDASKALALANAEKSIQAIAARQAASSPMPG